MPGTSEACACAISHTEVLARAFASGGAETFQEGRVVELVQSGDPHLVAVRLEALRRPISVIPPLGGNR